MKLKKFRIYNYKSIIDSGVCALSDDLTLLIGKNESGKTAVLEALRDFDQDAAIPESAVPLRASDEKPRLELTFTVSAEEIDELAQECNLQIRDHVRRYLLDEGLTLTKLFAGQYRLNGDHMNQLFDEIAAEVKPKVESNSLHDIQRKIYDLQQLLPPGAPLPDITQDGPRSALLQIPKIIATGKARLMLIGDEAKRDQAIEALRVVVHDLKKLDGAEVKGEWQGSRRDLFIYRIVQRLPRMVLFSDAIDILPFKVPAEEIEESEAVQSFARIARLDFKKAMRMEDVQRRINLFNTHTAIIRSDFLSRWGQNRIELVARPEGDALLFGVKESTDAEFFKVEQRSKGFQWFLSFYLKLQRYQSGAVVVMVDEPGINLHPSAQKDILNLFKHRPNEAMQIIYSTHSPCLIEADRLERVRFVIKDPRQGSRVECEPLDRLDQETLLPLQLAILSQQAVPDSAPGDVPVPGDTSVAAAEPMPLIDHLAAADQIPVTDAVPVADAGAEAAPPIPPENVVVAAEEPGPVPMNAESPMPEASAPAEDAAGEPEPAVKEEELQGASVAEEGGEQPKKSGFFSWFR